MMKGFGEILSFLGEGFFDLIYPSNIYCISCGNIIDDSRTYALCDVCVRTIKWANGRTCRQCGKVLQDDYGPDLCTDCIEGEHAFRNGFCCVEYGPAERDLIHRFKYGDKAYLGRKLAEMMYDRIQQENLNPDLILPVPMFRKKEKMRGYNQAAVLAKCLSGFMGVPCDTKLLIRTVDTEAMSSLGASERRRNIQNVFSLRHDKIGKPEGKRILLVDDIYTTGSTADACVSVLLEAGASEVFPYAFASGSNRIK